MSASSEITEWLASIELDQYAGAFAENEITIEMLPALSDSDLRELGVAALGHRKRLLAEIAKLVVEPNTEAELAEFDPSKKSDFTIPEMAPRSGDIQVAGDDHEQRLTSSPGAPPAHHPPAKMRAVGEARVVNRPVVTPCTPSPVALWPGFWGRLVASKFLFVSIVMHLIFAVGATYFIVQSITAKRKVTFQGGPPSTNPSRRALEHSVSMAKKKSGGAPPQAKRIVSAGLAQISLPDMPSIPTANTITSGMMTGFGGAGLGQGFGYGSGMGSGMGGGGGGGGSGFSFFGFRGSAANVVFVIDISGSMVSGNKNRDAYDRLEKEVLTALAALGATTKFNIIAFAGQPFVYAPAMVGAAMGEKEKATAWLKSYSPCRALPAGVDKGQGRLWQVAEGGRHSGTSSRKALERAFELRPGTIVFVSDGDPTDARPRDIIEDVAEWQKKLGTRATINAFAYKADEGQDFMEKLATGNGGTFKNIK